MVRNRPSHICRSCGTDIEKELEKARQSAEAAQERGKVWGASIPLECQRAGGQVAENWLPLWLSEAARQRGFAFDDPKKKSGGAEGAEGAAAGVEPNLLAEKKAMRLSCGVEVMAFWRRVMPHSTCWQNNIKYRVGAFDLASGQLAGAVYFDVANKYIPCVGVDAPFRRRGLGSILVTAAVTLCESVNPTLPGEGGYAPEASTAVLVKGARPNLCVSPKDLALYPGLHAFYARLGFQGGSPERGGNYTMAIEAGEALLASYAKPTGNPPQR